MDTTYRAIPRGAAQQVSGEKDSSGHPLAPGSYAGGYVLQAVLGSGGHGTVYKAEHRIIGRPAAVKVLHLGLSGQGEMQQRFIREARMSNLIHHPSIVEVYDYGLLEDGSPYYVMELLPGRTLAALLRERERLTPVQAMAFLEPVCAALDAAHRAGVVHRDLKASNVVVVAEGEPPKVKLLDFGIAKIVCPEPGEQNLTRDGQRLGTSHAMAPEQLRGGLIVPATDVYALGVLLYQMLTGDYPFQSENPLELERMHLEVPPPRPSACVPVSHEVDAVVLRCLEKEAERRFPDVGSFLAALQAAVAPPARERAAPDSGRLQALLLQVKGQFEGDEEDEQACTTLSEVLDTLQQSLRDEGFILAEQLGMTLLAARPLEAASAPELHAVLRMVRELHRQARLRTAHARVSMHFCVHVGEVAVSWVSSRGEAAGALDEGASEWVVHDGSGFTLTRTAVRAFATRVTG